MLIWLRPLWPLDGITLLGIYFEYNIVDFINAYKYLYNHSTLFDTITSYMITQCHCGCQYHVNITIVSFLMSLHAPGAFYSKPIMPRSAAYNDSSTHFAVKQGNQMFPTFFFLFLHFLFQTSIQMLSRKVLFSFGLKPQHNTLWIRTIPTTVSMVCYMYTMIHQHTWLLNKHQNVELCLLFNWSTIILPTFGLPQFVFVQHHISFLLFT